MNDELHTEHVSETPRRENALTSRRHVINNAIEEYVTEHPDFHAHDPDDVKMLARHIRDRLDETEYADES